MLLLIVTTMSRLILCIWSLALTGTGALYHLTSPSHPCLVASPENETVDIICQYRDGFVTTSPTGNTLACMSQNVIWQRADYHFTNLTDNTKYGVWDAVPGWKMAERKRISLLRVRNLQPEDMGLYQCRVQCLSEDGRVHVNQHMADLCVQHTPGYSICATKPLANKCSWAFGNGVCDRECDNEENLFDGFDCASPLAGCLMENNGNCQQVFANGVCDSDCESSACAWDGGDCIDKPLVFASDKIVINLATWYQRSGKTIDLKEIGRVFSKLLRTIVRVMPEDWPRNQAHDTDASWHSPDRRNYEAMRKIYLKIDNTLCYRRCFISAENAAKYIDLSLKNKWDPGVPITAIGVLSRTVNKCDLENNTLLHIDLPISPHKDMNPNIYSYSYAESSDSNLPPTWLLVTASIGGIVIIALILVIIIIILRIRKLSKEERHRAVADVNRIEDKTVRQGTDV